MRRVTAEWRHHRLSLVTLVYRLVSVSQGSGVGQQLLPLESTTVLATLAALSFSPRELTRRNMRGINIPDIPVQLSLPAGDVVLGEESSLLLDPVSQRSVPDSGDVSTERLLALKTTDAILAAANLSFE